MTFIFEERLNNFLLKAVQEQCSNVEHGSSGMKEMIMHHVKDEVIFPLHILNFDISITKHILMLWIASAVLMISLPLIVRSKSLIPKGPVNFIEWITVFIKDSVLEPNLGKYVYKYAPYLLTAFFFILTCNLL